MDDEVVLDQPLGVVFHYVATPTRLTDWIPAVLAVDSTTATRHGDETVGYVVSLHASDGVVAGLAEVIECEPPLSVVYRIVDSLRTAVVRVSFRREQGRTIVRVHQLDDGTALAVDLVRLRRAIGVEATASVNLTTGPITSIAPVISATAPLPIGRADLWPITAPHL